jgi:hypothetical protein
VLDDVLRHIGSEDSVTPAVDDEVQVELEQGYSQSLLPGYLALQSGGRSRYLHNNFWANVCSKV